MLMVAVGGSYEVSMYHINIRGEPAIKGMNLCRTIGIWVLQGHDHLLGPKRVH